MDSEFLRWVAQVRGWKYEIGYLKDDGTYETFCWTSSEDHSKTIALIKKEHLGIPKVRRLLVEVNN